MFHFYNTFLSLFKISSLFSGGIIISLIGFCFLLLSLFELVTPSAILCPKNLRVLWTSFLKGFSRVSNNCFLYFLANNKNPYPFNMFFCSWFYRILCHFYFLLISNVKLILSSISNGLPF